jgi:nicotinamide-nucleotide amidase
VKISHEVFLELQKLDMKLTTAESCTGGMVAATITDIAGSSTVFDRGFVTYSNAAKVEMLGVPFDLISQFGAVSEEVAIAMAQGAMLHSAADIAVSITGVAGPSGGSDLKPVGLVHFAVAMRETTVSHVQRFGNLSRAEIRNSAVQFAFEIVLAQLTTEP